MTGKIDFTVGGISFSGEGEEAWLASQLDKIIEKAPSLLVVAPVPEVSGEGKEAAKQEPMKQDPNIAGLTLSNFLKEKNSTRNQMSKFLATAVWLEAKGKTRIATSDIVQALKDANQSRLANASDLLAKNVTKGYCERDGKEFFVTTEGKASLG